jgi:hypothetical protein
MVSQLVSAGEVELVTQLQLVPGTLCCIGGVFLRAMRASAAPRDSQAEGRDIHA